MGHLDIYYTVVMLILIGLPLASVHVVLQPSHEQTCSSCPKAYNSSPQGLIRCSAHEEGLLGMYNCL
jgi:hypothetical protein